MKKCEDFSVRKALIFHQEDYTLARMIDAKGSAQWYDLPNTKQDAEIAKQIAHGFGIEDCDIVLIEDWTVVEIKEVFE